MAELWSRLAFAQTMMESWKVLSHVKKVWIGHTFGTVHSFNPFHWNTNLVSYTEAIYHIMAKNWVQMANVFCFKNVKEIWHSQWCFFFLSEYLMLIALGMAIQFKKVIFSPLQMPYFLISFAIIQWISYRLFWWK